MPDTDAVNLDELLNCFLTADWAEKRQFLLAKGAILLDGRAEITLNKFGEQEANSELARILMDHRALLEECRTKGVEAAFAEREAAQPDRTTHLINQLLAADLDIEIVQQLIEENAAVLLDPAMDTWLEVAGRKVNDDYLRGSLEGVTQLLRSCRENGIQAAFERLAGERSRARLQQWALELTFEPDGSRLRAALDSGSNELLSDEFDEILTQMIANLEAHRRVLQECRNNSEGTFAQHRVSASANVVDPSEQRLTKLLVQLEELPDDDAAADQRIELYRRCLSILSCDRNPTAWAHLHMGLGTELRRIGEVRKESETVMAAIDSFESAKLIFTNQNEAESLTAALNNLGNALRTLGDLETGTAHLQAAVENLRSALERTDRHRAPTDWARIQSNLGAAMSSLGEREAGTETLEAAVDACRKALLVRTRQGTPFDWARTQDNLGSALHFLGSRQPGTATLAAAVDAFRSALEVFTFEASPLDWAKSQRALSSVLLSLGKREAGTTRMEAAADVLRSAVNAYDSKQYAQLWAETQKELGDVLFSVANRDPGIVHLEAAINAFRAALTVYTPERIPRDWAAIHEKLGLALRLLGERNLGSAELEESIAEFQLALAVYSRDAAPEDWARNQSMISNALLILGERTGQIDLLKKAVEVSYLGLEVIARDHAPSEWARIKASIGLALHSIAGRETDTQNAEAAVAAFREALEVLTPEIAPNQWAATQSNLGNALCTLGLRENGTANLEASAEALLAAIKAHAAESSLPHWADACNNLGITLVNLAAHETDKNQLKVAVKEELDRLVTLDANSPEVDKTKRSLEISVSRLINFGPATNRLEGAIVAFRAALSVFTKEAAPSRWAGIQLNLANALRARGESDAETSYLEASVDASRAALDVYTRRNAPHEWAKVHVNLGGAFFHLFRRGAESAGVEAVNAFRAALTVCRRETSPAEWVAAQTNLAHTLDGIARKSQTPEDWRIAAQAWQELLDSALVIVSMASRNRDVQRSMNSIWQIGSAAALSWLRGSDPWASFKAAHKARSIQARAVVWADMESVDETLTDEFRKRRAAWQTAAIWADAIGEHWRRGGGKHDDWQEYQAAVVVVHETFQAYRAVLKEPPDLDLASIAAVLPVGGALVTLIAGDDYGGALMVRADSTARNDLEMLALSLPELSHQNIYRLLSGGGSLAEYIAENENHGTGWFGGFDTFRKALADSNSPALSEAWLNWNNAIVDTMNALGTLGVGDIQRWLKKEGVMPDSEIVLSPSGLMSMLPISAARDPETGRCLLDDYAIRTIPSVDLLLRCADSAHQIEPDSYSLFGVTDPREDLLSNLERETPALEAFAGLQIQTLAGHESTRSRVTSSLGTATHFVYYGHGGFDSRLGRSSLLLAHDLEYPDLPDEISDAELRQLRLSNLRLGVLGACETGLVDFHQPDEFVGLIESLLQAGCATVIASLWPVAAGVTKELMSQMLLRHVRGNDSGQRESPAQALRRAQLAVRGEARSIHALRAQAALPGSVARAMTYTPVLTSDQPIFWAAFTCAGA